MTTYRQIGAETVRALALLAMYALVLLAPLHQAAATQRDFAKAGYETVASWSVCAPLAEDADGENTVAVVKCPAQGISKDGLVLPNCDLGSAWLSPRDLDGFVSTDEALLPPRDGNVHVSGPRAPPQAA